MLYFIGGAARSGKSIAARRFLRATGIPFFSLDYLMMGLARGLPQYGVNPEDDELHVGDLLWPVVRPLAVALIEDGVDYLIEGVQLRPRFIAELSGAMPGAVCACFLGYADVAVEAKLTQLRRFGGDLHDWMRHYDEAHMIATIKRLKQLSAELRDECHHYRVPYLETGLDLEKTVASVLDCLFRSSDSQSSAHPQ